MPSRNGPWPLLGICVLGICGLLFAATIILSLIPIYLSVRSTAPLPDSSVPIQLSYNISADALNLTLPLTSLPDSALKFLQRDFQSKLDADPQSAGSSITLESGQINRVGSSGKKRQLISKELVTLILVGRLKFSGTCRGSACQTRVFKRVIQAILLVLSVNLNDLQTAILTGLTTTTTTLTTVTTTTATTTTVSTQPASPIITSTTIAPVTSGGASASIIPTTTVAGRRRRRSIVPPVQVTTYMPIGGCLVISLDNTTKFIDEFRRDYAFVKHLPLGIQLVQGVDGQTIDLYRLLREEKISRSSYNQLIVQSSLVTGHNLTLGSLGCLQSHVRAWEQVVQANTPMLILEDDVRFNRQLFDSMLPYLLYSLPTNFSLLYFGNLIGHVMESQLTDYNELLWKMNGSNWGTYAYLISPQGAAALLEYVYPAQAQVDSTIINIALSQSLNVFMSKQLLVKTENKFRRRSKTQRYLVSPIVIPQVFHFIWLGAPMKPAHQRNIDLWGKLHPKWEIRLWTMDSLAKSGLTMYNKDQWAKFSRGARQAADILRYEIIYQYGGIYVDVDFEPLRSLEPILHGVQAFVAHESEPFVCNGIFGAVPGHELSERLVMGLESSMITFQNGTVNQQTGPYHMTRQIDAMREEGKTTMKLGFETFAPHVFFPYAWYEKDPGAPYDSLAYTVHHFRSMQEIEQDFKAGH